MGHTQLSWIDDSSGPLLYSLYTRSNKAKLCEQTKSKQQKGGIKNSGFRREIVPCSAVDSKISDNEKGERMS